MLLIPQFYMRNGKVVLGEGARSSLLVDDPVQTAGAMKAEGAEAIHIVDLSVPHVGQSPNLPIIKKIKDEVGAQLFVDGQFKTQQAVEGYVDAGVTFVVLNSTAYQQPAFLQELCKSFPNKIGVHIDVKGSKVTIPGYAVVANKTALDYAERFTEAGVRYILHSDVKADGTLGEENFKNLLNFCKEVTARIMCTSEVANLSDIERIFTLGAPRLEGLILARSLHEDRIDLRSAIAMVNDLIIASGNEETLAEL